MKLAENLDMLACGIASPPADILVNNRIHDDNENNKKSFASHTQYTVRYPRRTQLGHRPDNETFYTKWLLE
jgi:hypothetical protein